MSWFIKVLKFILCLEDEGGQERVENWSKYDYHRVAYDNSVLSRTTTSNTLTNHYNSAQETTKFKLQDNRYQSCSNLLSNPKRETFEDNSIPKRTAVATKPVRPLISEKSEVPPKPKSFPLSSTADVLQSSNVNQIIKKVTEPNFPNHRQPSVTTKPNPPSILQKLSEISQKPKNVYLSSSDGTSPGGNSAYRATSKTADRKLSSDVCSASSKPLHSSPNLPLFSGSSELLSSASEKEKPSSTFRKDPSSSCPFVEKSHSAKPPPLSTKPTVCPAPSSFASHQKKTNYVWVEKSASSTYVFPEDIKSLIEKDIVPGVLKMPLSMSTYKNYFHALLYSEDCHLEKWDGFEIKNVTLEFHDAAIYTRKGKSKQFNEAEEKDEKILAAFEIDKIPERRPFLLSRDFVSVKPSGRQIKPFQGVIYRVVKSNLVLAEFGEDFHSQHNASYAYDVKFSFNRVCLKRAHHAISAASDTLYRNFLFPNFAREQELPSTELFPHYEYRKDALAICQILRLQGAPPYLLEGPLSVSEKKHLSRTGVVTVEAILRILRAFPSNRILLCAPLNNTCDVLMRFLKKEISESVMFRANAAFREIDGVPLDILPSCLYKRKVDLFACPSLEELKQYKVILSTYMSSFRLRDEGLKAGYFSHIFLIDASSVTEPETMVPLANFATAETVVVVTGAPRNHSGWVRSKIARQNGLMTSYFERLSHRGLYNNLDQRVIMRLGDAQQNSNESSSSFWI